MHLKLWVMSDAGLKLHTVLPPPKELSENFVDHKVGGS